MKTARTYKIQRNPETESFQHTLEKIRPFSYKVVQFDEEGWADAEKFKPIPFDLVKVITLENKEKNAWWAVVKDKLSQTQEEYWDGIRLKPTDKVIKWKRRLYEWIE